MINKSQRYEFYRTPRGQYTPAGATLNHAMDPDHRADMIPAPVKIGDKVWIGANVTILQGVTIGDGAVIAAGAIVNRDVTSRTVVGGIPAKVIKEI